MTDDTPVQCTLNKPPCSLLFSSSVKSPFLAGLSEDHALEAKVMRCLEDNTLLVSINGTTAIAKCTIPLHPEQQVQVRVAATRPQVVMKLVGEAIPDEEALCTPRLTSNRPVNRSLVLLLSPSEKDSLVAKIAQGQVLQGKVEKDIADHIFQVTFRGFKVAVDSTACLKAGQQVLARVVQTHPRVVLNLIPEGMLEQKALSLITGCDNFID